MDWLNTPQSISEIDYRIRRDGEKVAVYFYGTMAFARASYRFVQTVAAAEADIEFHLVPLDNREQEVEAGQRYGVTSLPQLLIFGGMRRQGEPGVRKVLPTSIQAIRVALAEAYQ